MTAAIHGFCDPRFERMREAFAANFESGLEIGASLALTHRGKTVVDLWAGWADPARTRRWEENTVVSVASTTKVATAMVALTLVDRGLIELDAPIARYWPEFAQGGKERVTIRDAFTHQAGVPGFSEPVNYEQYCDWDYITGRIAAEPHWFGGERRVVYHSGTYGFPLGEVVRRVDGRKPSQFFRDEIATPLGIDFQIALIDRADMARLAKINPPLPPPPDAVPLPPLAARILASIKPGGDGASWEARSSELPSGGGVTNGRAIAKLTSLMAMRGTAQGRIFFSEAIVREAAADQAHGVCPLMGEMTLGLGFGKSSALFKYPSETTYGWGGLGGSWALMDPRTGCSLGYAPNNWESYSKRSEDVRVTRIGEAFGEVLKGLAS
ncbi:MAG: beta-lactamase family protein [Alphaproteobacteria bacterium]|nr:beta-lactamase family protein [Alphaproteobacteria bacterium]MBV9540983.1 beta-lactamase family protein [Alphaproteobacteria bacterium]MBV9903128.1 beta-lactamase family protein [Alphaproteobacteria bacterium]